MVVRRMHRVWGIFDRHILALTLIVRRGDLAMMLVRWWRCQTMTVRSRGHWVLLAVVTEGFDSIVVLHAWGIRIIVRRGVR
jgi:hypothetical protein